ncbi:hypothetical protein HCN44_001976 [Aphidius gifuensis]|uniref:Uncharacterized protein n=1 Tax=Aphidius gifuensis TaxID=684658 RepID=A0A835CTU1_APHGI|nr:hypothetical protein HCN44_001976 [Aphidius gifuensis]
MSGILRNTLRLAGTAKYATNNSTKYLRSMTLKASRFHSTQPQKPIVFRNIYTDPTRIGSTLLDLTKGLAQLIWLGYFTYLVVIGPFELPLWIRKRLMALKDDDDKKKPRPTNQLAD